MRDPSKIPAANIGDLNLDILAQTQPSAATEIGRIVDLMDRGEETKSEFLKLCQLLFDVGAAAESEYLLRRNLEYYEGKPLYAKLFGTKKQVELDYAIEAFAAQFDVELVLTDNVSFLVSRFHSMGPPRSDEFALLSRPCEIEFGYTEQETIEADVNLLDATRQVFEADECMLLFFVNGVWELTDG